MKDVSSSVANKRQFAKFASPRSYANSQGIRCGKVTNLEVDCNFVNYAENKVRKEMQNSQGGAEARYASLQLENISL